MSRVRRLLGAQPEPRCGGGEHPPTLPGWGRPGWRRLVVAVLGIAALMASDAVVSARVAAALTPAPIVATSQRPPAPLASPPVTRPTPTVPAGGYALAPSTDRTSATELVSRRTATSSTWRHRDGSLTVLAYAAPHYYRPSASAGWQPIDSSLHAVPGHPGRYATGANNWQATFEPTGSPDGAERISVSGHTIAFSPRSAGLPAAVPTATGSTVTYTAVWPDTDVVDRIGPSGVEEDIVLRSPTAPAAFRFDVSGVAPHPNGSGGVDLTSGGAVLGSIPAPVVHTAGPGGGAVEATQASGARLTAAGTIIDVSVSPTWLAALPRSAFPVVIDPTVILQAFSPSSVVAYSSTGATAGVLAVGANASGTWNGAFQLTPPAFPAEQTGQPWQITLAELDISCPSPCTLNSPKLYNETAKPTSYSAVPTGYLVPGVTGAGTGLLQARVETDTLYTSRKSSWFGLVANVSSGGYAQIPTADISMTLNYTENPPPARVVSPTNGSVLTTTTPTLTGQLFDSNICPATLTRPAYCDDWIDLYLNFRISTAADPSSGQTVAESGWKTWPIIQNPDGTLTPGTPTWTVPSGSLVDGTTYYAVLSVANDPQYPAPPWSNLPAPSVNSDPVAFQIKQRMGAGGPSPTDNIGTPPGGTATPSEGAPSPGTPVASETVDMVTGNLAFTVPAPSMTTVGGAVGVKMSYDSIRSSVTGSMNFGLTARYYHDSGAHTFPTAIAAQRVDPSVNVNGSASAPPIGGIAPYTGYLARWTGTLTLPSGTWKLGGVSTGGLRIFVNGATSPSYNDWAGNDLRTPTFSSSTLAGPVQMNIQVEAWESGQNQSTAIQLWATDATSSSPRTFIVPSNWLLPAATGLPQGWTLSGGAPGTIWTNVSDLGAQVVARSSTGDTSTFTKNSDGSYRPQPGRTEYLSVAKGLLQLSTVSGMQYTFNPDGSLSSVITVADARHPASVRYTYGLDTFASGSPAVLRSLTDPVSGRSITLSYGADAACPSTNAAGLLCAVTNWDGSKTSYVYNGNNQLAEVLNPGNAATLFAYDTSNRISLIRDALANDYIASAQPGVPAGCTTTGTSTGCPFDTQVVYDAQGRVTSVLQPAPTATAARPKRTYVYATGSTTVKIAGFAPTSGTAGAVTFDAKSRITKRSDATGHTAYTVWDAVDRPIISVDTTGQQTSTVWDEANDATDTYGPAPMACFDPATVPVGAAVTAPVKGYLPLAAATTTTGCNVSVPHTHHGYDEGVLGLARTYWSNGQFAGAPALRSTASDGPSATCAMTGVVAQTASGSDDSVCADWPAGTAPVATDAQHKWSERMSGLWTPQGPAGSSFVFYLQASQPFTLYIDGVRLLTNITYSATGAPTGIVTTPVSNVVTYNDSQRHRFDLQFEGDSTGDSYYYIVVVNFPGSRTMWVPFTSLDPGYGLETSVTDPDGKTTATGYTGGGLDAQYGLATSTTADPQGLALTSTTTYESPGPTTYLRPLSQTLPAGTTTTYSYYAATDGPLAAVCGVAAGTPQGGLVQTQIDAATAGAAAREQQFVYDAAGRVAGRRVGSTTSVATASWQCTTYDVRGRILQESWPAFNGAAARTVSYTYAVGGDPTRTSVSDTSDPGGTITTTVDMLGRLVLYTDALGQTTTMTYDQAGRPAGSSGVQGSLASTYDPQTSQLTGISRNGTTLATVSYNAATGRVAKVTYQNGTTGTLAYGPLGNLRGTTYTNTATSAFVAGDIVTRSPAGRIVSERMDINGTALTNPNPAGDTAVDYTYDGAGRLVGAYLPGALASYGYDPNPAGDSCPVAGAGANTNRTRVTVMPTGGTATTTDYCYNQADQLTASVVGPARNSQYAYDTHGNQTNDHGTTLVWDAADRLVKTTTAAGVVTTYAYDPLDQVISRTTGTTTVKYAYSGYSSGPAATLTAAGAVNQQFIPLPNGVMLTAQASGDRWSYADMHDNYTVVTDGSGVRQGAPVTFDPWGAPNGGAKPLDNSAGSGKLGPFGMDGKVTDGGTGITIMGARPYSAAEGRFLGIDPVVGGCANAYTYAYGDPLTQQDLDGRNYCWHMSVIDALDLAAVLQGTGRISEFLARFGIGGPEAAAAEEVLSIASTYYAAVIEGAADTAAFLAKQDRRHGYPDAKGMVLMELRTVHILGHDTKVPFGPPLFDGYVVNGSPGGRGAGGC